MYGYTRVIQGTNIINSVRFININYVFNNIVHDDYEGKVYTEESFSYVAIKPISILGKIDVFPEYTGDCEFIGWNTRANATGTYYYPDDIITISEDLTLYAIWRSCKPIVNPIYQGATLVSGRGVVGKGGINSSIRVVFPGNIVVTYTTSGGDWETTVPVGSRPLLSGMVVSVNQSEQGKRISDPVSVVVI